MHAPSPWLFHQSILLYYFVSLIYMTCLTCEFELLYQKEAKEMRTLYHEVIKTEVKVSRHVKHERLTWCRCGLRHGERTHRLYLKGYI